MSHETPGAGARQSVLETKTGADGVLWFVKPGTVVLEATGLDNNAEQLLQQVKLMGGEVIEVTTTGNVGLQAPGEFVALRIVQLTRRNGKAHLYIDRFTDGATLNDTLHFIEIRQFPAVVGNEAGDARLFRHTVNAGTVVVRGCQGLLHIDWLATPHSHDGKGGMTRRWRSNIDGIHLRVVNQFLRVSIVFWDAMTFCIGTGTLLTTTHDSLDV